MRADKNDNQTTSTTIKIPRPSNNPIYLRRGEDLIQIAHGVVNDEAEDAHLGGPALVELDGALLGLPLVGLLVPAKVEAVAPVAAELGGAGAVGVANFQDGAGSEDPKVVGEGHVPKGLEAGGAALGAGEAVASVR